MGCMAPALGARQPLYSSGDHQRADAGVDPPRSCNGILGVSRCGYSQAELDAIRMIEYLKRSGLEIKDIRQFFEWVEEGPSTYPNRKAMFEARKKAVEEEMKQLEKNLDMLKFKCWYYEKAMEDGNEDEIHAMLPDKLPADIQALYDNSHDRNNA